jgi:hypothetical protein
VLRDRGWTCEYHEPVSGPGECSQCDDAHQKTAIAIIDALHLTREAYTDGSEVFDPDEWPERRPLEYVRFVGPWVKGSDCV